ncbi:hypothetical protein GCM10009539_01980 [Cryptosporangium japonicum]|uniref:Uncharacterized protein n=1 Tax=Cryptosporangium japonicum TaxID=80872 RepID=A0ABN0TFC8_9ACTN
MSGKAAARAALAETVRSASTLTEKHQVTDLLPAPEPLLTLFPAGGLARGSTLAVGRSSSLLVALLAAVSSAGSWCAVVGLPAFGVVAAAEAGVTVDRLALVRDPGPDPAGVVGALLDGFDLVVVGDPRGLGLAEVRRLTARARQRGAVLVGIGSWPSADLRLSLTDALWQGAGRGDGRLRQRRVTVVAEGRGNASRPRHVVVLLPTPDGRIAPVLQPAAPIRAVPDPDPQLRPVRPAPTVLKPATRRPQPIAASHAPAAADPAAADRPAPGPAAPGPAAPGPAAPGPAAPGPAVPGPAVPGPAVPGPAVPGPAVPGPAVIGPAAPGRAVPGRVAAAVAADRVVADHGAADRAVNGRIAAAADRAGPDRTAADRAAAAVDERRAPAVRIRAIVPNLPGVVPASSLPQPAPRKLRAPEAG